jgi:F-type H+-transporting ATPase subunit epsilon
MKDHAPVMTVLKAGIVEIDEAPNRKSRLFVRGGFADVAAGALTLLAEQATPLEQFDSARLAQEITNAEEDLADATSDEALKLAADKLDQLKELKAAIAA